MFGKVCCCVSVLYNSFKKCWIFEFGVGDCHSDAFQIISVCFLRPNRNLHEFPCDRKEEKRKKRRRTRLSAPASKLIGLWPIWPQGPSSPTRPIRAQTSCSAAGHRGGATADYNQRKSTFIRRTTSLHFFLRVRELDLASHKAAEVSSFACIRKARVSTGNHWISSHSNFH